MFTPFSTALGALLLSTSTTFLLYTLGRILGIAGILRTFSTAPSLTFNVPFLVGLGASVPLVKQILPNFIPDYPQIEVFGLGKLSGVNEWIGVVLLGVLTGWGTKAGCGCTSGHMLCGLSRFSVRSLIAALVFFPAAVLTAGFSGALDNAGCGEQPCYTAVWPTTTEAIVIVAVVVVAFLVNNILRRWLEKDRTNAKPESEVVSSPLLAGGAKADAEPADERKVAKAAVSFVAGLEFGLGLLISGMADPMKPLRFFALPFDISKWDPSLALIVVFGLGTNIVVTQFKGLSGKPALDKKLWLPEGKVTDIGLRYLLGAAAFGVSWGLSGVCPGPGVLKAVIHPLWGVVWLVGYWIGGLF